MQLGPAMTKTSLTSLENEKSTGKVPLLPYTIFTVNGLTPTPALAVQPAKAPEITQQKKSGDASMCWYVVGILSSIFCCPLFGVIGMVHAMIAKHEGEKGNHAGARRRMYQAKCWTLWAIGIGFLTIIAGALLLYSFCGVRLSNTESLIETAGQEHGRSDLLSSSYLEFRTRLVSEETKFDLGFESDVLVSGNPKKFEGDTIKELTTESDTTEELINDGYTTEELVLGRGTTDNAVIRDYTNDEDIELLEKIQNLQNMEELFLQDQTTQESVFDNRVTEESDFDHPIGPASATRPAYLRMRTESEHDAAVDMEYNGFADEESMVNVLSTQQMPAFWNFHTSLRVFGNPAVVWSKTSPELKSRVWSDNADAVLQFLGLVDRTTEH